MRVGIRVNRPEVPEELLGLLPPGWKPAATPVVEELYSLKIAGEGTRPGVRHFHLVYCNAGRISRTTDLTDALMALESDLHLYVAKSARRRVFVHAGVVGWQGRAIVLPGRSFAGKSTLVAALVRAGATYYSDEFAVFDEQGRVHPYARPLSLRQADLARPRRLRPEELGGRAGRQPLPVGLVAVCGYREGAKWRPRRLTEGQAALALLENTVPARTRPQAVLSTLHQVVPQARLLKGSRGEAEDVAQALLSASA